MQNTKGDRSRTQRMRYKQITKNEIQKEHRNEMKAEHRE